MRNDELILRGKIDTKGVLRTYGLRDMEKFVKIHHDKSDGKDVDILIRISVLSSSSVEKRIGYIYGKIIPEFIRAFKEQGLRLTKKQANEKVKDFSSVCRGKEIESLTFYELGDMIDELKEVAAEHFGFYIDDSVVL